MSELGERAGADGLRFVRHFSTSIERVWQAITTPEGIAAWLGRAVTLEAVAGGAFEVELTADTVMDGAVLEIEPPRRLAIRWHETSDGVSLPYGTQIGDTSLITFELTPDAAGGTILIFTHRRIRDGEIMTSFGAGWHALLEALTALVADEPRVDVTTRYAELKPGYDARFSSPV
jgi:uncharacterized protein YndB with AHSA1/START domain